MGGVLLGALAVFGGLRFSAPASAQTDGWVTGVDGKSMDGWDRVGDANWSVADGSGMADKLTGKDQYSYLVSKKSYKDFQIKAEFWVDDEANSGIFLRCSDPKKIDSVNCYEVNIF